MNYHSYEINEIINHLNTSEDGLKEIEASNRLLKQGKNKLAEKKKDSKIKLFFKEFNDIMIIILLVASIVSFIISLIDKEPFTDTIIILAIVILNAILGFMEELKADKAIEELKKMQNSLVKVKRDNKIEYLNSEELVRGDLIILEAGDKVPADSRIIWESSLKVDESSLTGESVPVEKSIKTLSKETPLSLRTNMIYSGTNIVYGKCHALICETGMNTQMGIIANYINEDIKEITPLQEKINDISKVLSMIIGIIIFLMFIVGIIKKIPFLEILMLSISLAVAAIPEGLPAIITIILSLGMNSMAKKKAIVRKMSSVETLGSTEIICSDKTGTITQNKMTVREIYYNNKILSIDDIKEENILLIAMILNNDTEKNNNEYIGEPTEIALYKAGENIINIEELRNNNQRIGEIPFDSERKMMSTINKNNNKIKLYCKGSFDSIINKCSYIYENDKIIKLSAKRKKELKLVEENESNKAYRLITFAYKCLEGNIDFQNEEKSLIFIGMAAMIDPPRDDVKEAISMCKKANIKPIMITGDSVTTAKTIAKEIGILSNDSEAIEGKDIDCMTEEELQNNIEKYTVYARVSPLNKLSIIKSWKNKNKIVAMTGDGVNDAAALKNADIGIGMGINGTEVSKSVSDIILVDDSFSTIVTAIKEGRRIYDNIRNVLVYLLTGNIAEVFVVFIGMIYGIEIFTPIQLLYINLITDSLPAISLAFEKSDENIMTRKTRKKGSSFFTPFLIAKMSLSAFLKTFLIVYIYLINYGMYDNDIAKTTAFLTLTLLEITFVFTCKNLKEPISEKQFLNNKYINICTITLIIIQLIVFLTPIRNIFNLTTLTFNQIMYSVITVIVVFLIDELSKNIIKKYFED